MSTPMNSFAQTLRSSREARSFTLAQLASAVGCAKSYLSSLENGQRPPPADDIIKKIEVVLELPECSLLNRARLDRGLLAGGTPLRAQLETLNSQRDAARRLAQLITRNGPGKPADLDALYSSGELRKLVEQIGIGEATDDVLPVTLGRAIPVINKVAAGYPAEFTDLSYPARVADDYVRHPDISDPDAFAARIVGDSMMPNYLQGDIVIFSPAKPVVDGCDCFARLEPNHESTFKRVYFENVSNQAMIRLQPINNAYPPRTLHREQVAGLYAAAAVIRAV